MQKCLILVKYTRDSGSSGLQRQTCKSNAADHQSKITSFVKRKLPEGVKSRLKQNCSDVQPRLKTLCCGRRTRLHQRCPGAAQHRRLVANFLQDQHRERQITTHNHTYKQFSMSLDWEEGRVPRENPRRHKENIPPEGPGWNRPHEGLWRPQRFHHLATPSSCRPAARAPTPLNGKQLCEYSALQCTRGDT